MSYRNIYLMAFQQSAQVYPEKMLIFVKYKPAHGE